MAKRSTAETLRLRTEREAARLEAKRRELRERHQHIPAQAWSNLGVGLGGVGGKALRGWLISLVKLSEATTKSSS